MVNPCVSSTAAPVMYFWFEFRSAVYLGQVQEQLLGLPYDWGVAAHFTARLDELHGIDQLTAQVTLVTACILVTALGTRAFHEPVRQIPANTVHTFLLSHTE